MLPFEFHHLPGKPASEQLVLSVKKALAKGQLKPGDSFPSVRSLSRELRINPNTAQKAITLLTQAGILEITPGIGTWVRHQPKLSPAEMAAVLDEPTETLVIEAKRLGLSLYTLEARIRFFWNDLNRKTP